MRQQGDASVEEILESIKRVIARDVRPARGTAASTADDDRPDPVAQDEVEDVLDLDTDDVLVDTADVDGADADRADGDGPLTAETTRNAMRDNLAALAMLAEPGAKPQIVRSGETSLEGMAREMLRPMLAQWLDENLPPMVERLVKEEIARIARKGD